VEAEQDLQNLSQALAVYGVKAWVRDNNAINHRIGYTRWRTVVAAKLSSGLFLLHTLLHAYVLFSYRLPCAAATNDEVRNVHD
jgi:hypothetical protein